MNTTSESIYENICRARNELGILPREYSLPQDGPSLSDQFRFADGALDGIAIYHMGVPDQDSRLLEQALDTAVTDLEQAHVLIQKWAADGHMISAMDKIQHYIIEHQQQLPPSQIYRLAAECALKGTHREEVKFGLIIMPFFNTDSNEQLKNSLRILALSDEFTLYILQVASGWSSPSQETLRIARNVYGWGRIHAVAQLEPETEEIRDWLFTEGWDNTVTPAYSALECCNKGNLLERLEKGMNDKDYRCACGLLQALLDEGPVEGISGVEDSVRLLNAFLECSASKAVSPARQKTLEKIAEYVAGHELQEIAEKISALL
ncbi:MAG: hypothetical protein K2O34_13440 [Acetatifactor sp.]|nr:hypothetical protein [Acetatifactor sp.]